jgi:hypothetical protein
LVYTCRCWRSNCCSSFDSPGSIFAQCSWALCVGGGWEAIVSLRARVRAHRRGWEHMRRTHPHWDAK